MQNDERDCYYTLELDIMEFRETPVNPAACTTDVDDTMDYSSDTTQLPSGIQN